MKFGYQTILYGTVLYDVRRAIVHLASCGFRGIEISQHPKHILEDGEPISYGRLLELLETYDLRLLGLAGGSVRTRIEYCESCGRLPLPNYLYVDENKTDDFELALEHGFTIGLHPHIFRSISNFAQLKSLSSKYQPDQVGLIPDTAHLYITGDDPTASIAGVLDRCLSVHIKDWTSAYGFSPLRYAKGFVNLFEGQVPIAAVLNMLGEKGYDGWVIAEQDYAREAPETTILETARLLNLDHSVATVEDTVPPLASRIKLQSAVLEGQTRSLRDCYGLMVKSIREETGGITASIVACSPSVEDIVLLSHSSSDPSLPYPTRPSLPKKNSYLASVLEENVAISIDIKKHLDEGQPFAWAEYAESVGAKWATFIPVPVRHNPHSAHLCVLILHRNNANHQENELFCVEIANAVAAACDVALEEECAIARRRVRRIGQQTETLAQFLDQFVQFAIERTSSQTATIFVNSIAEDRLIPRASSGLVWQKGRVKKWYDEGDFKLPDLTPKCWRENSMMILNRRRVRDKWYSWEDTEDSEVSIVLLPICQIQSANSQTRPYDVIGVLRCMGTAYRQDLSVSQASMLTEDDITILDSACQSAAPYIEWRRTYEQRLLGISRITHELKTPVNALRHELRYTELHARGALRQRQVEVPQAMTKAYKTTYALANVAIRVVNNAALYGLGTLGRLSPSRIGLVGNVIAPAVDQASYLFQKEKLDINNVNFGTVDTLPFLYVDQSMMQQVFFNLLSNAVKYAHPQKSEFKVDIKFDSDETGFYIFVEDEGLGIEDSLVEIIFEDGIRGPVEQAKAIEGMGIGLYVVRLVIRAHGGTIRVSKSSNPTTFEIWLPKVLQSGFPKELLEGSSNISSEPN